MGTKGTIMSQAIGIQLNQYQLESLSNGATALLFVVEDERLIDIWENKRHSDEDTKMFLNLFSPLQPNQEYYVQEEFVDAPMMGMLFKNDNALVCNNWLPASQMTYEQSRYRFTVKSIEVKRVQELTQEEWVKMNRLPSSYLFNEQYGQGTYESNPYIFYVVIEKD